MNEPIINSQSQAQSHLEKAETYKKLNLYGQVRYELEQAKQLDPYIVHEARYKTIIEANASKVQDTQALRTPLRIGAGMLFVNALFDVVILILILISGNTAGLGGGDFAAPIVKIIIGVNLWQVKEQWQRYTVWLTILGLVLFGIGALVSGNYISLITQVGFGGSLILLLAGKPSKARTIAAVAVYSIAYIGLSCLFYLLSFLGGLASTG